MGNHLKISTVYARFYKSLNFDYVSKSVPGSSVAEWDLVQNKRSYPHVHVPLEPSITTIVGSNESGKTQVIDAIRFALTGEGIARRDFCRYSEFFAVDAPVLYPEFGIEVVGKDPTTVAAVNQLLGLEDETLLTTLDGVRIFRRAIAGNEQGGLVFWTALGGAIKSRSFESLNGWADLLPEVWEIDADVALPDSVPIDWLLDQKAENALSRHERLEVVNSMLGIQNLLLTEISIKQNAARIASTLSKPKRASAEARTQLSVAADLLFRVAEIDRSNIEELRQAIEDGAEGYVATIVDSINDQIDRKLAPNRWWTQDSEFRVLISPRDHDLVLTIRDRTGKDYTFDERSRGLKYFLSYLVQFLAGRPPAGSRQKVLLMDEPDAYLSGQ